MMMLGADAPEQLSALQAGLRRRQEALLSSVNMDCFELRECHFRVVCNFVDVTMNDLLKCIISQDARLYSLQVGVDWCS